MAERKSRGATGRAYDYLYQGILSGFFPLGSPLSENDIAEALGISRSPIREALKMMESEGLVTHYPGRGTFVTDFTRQDLEEIFELRILLELHALHNACQYAEEEKLNRLEEAFLSLTEDSDPQEYYAANNALHSTIVSWGGNKRLEKFYLQLSSQFAIVNRISSKDPEHFPSSREKHLEITRAIRARDYKKAKECLSKHLNEVRNKTLSEFLYPSSDIKHVSTW